jgi:hypothetical protein
VLCLHLRKRNHQTDEIKRHENLLQEEEDSVIERLDFLGRDRK